LVKRDCLGKLAEIEKAIGTADVGALDANAIVG